MLFFFCKFLTKFKIQLNKKSFQKEEKMKRNVKKFATVFFATLALVLGTSQAFADEALYNELLAKGKDYEEKSQWVHAMGAYWDAMAAYPEGAKEAFDNYTNINNGFRKGNPGPGEFDDFSRYDGWIEVCKDFEIYWTEHSDEIVYVANMKAQKGELDMKTRTATYGFEAKEYTTPKFNQFQSVIINSFSNAYKKDWTDIPSEWPIVSIFRDSKTISVVKFLSASNNGLSPLGTKQEVSPFDNWNLTNRDKSTIYLQFPYKKTTDYYTAAWNALYVPGYKTIVPGATDVQRAANAAVGISYKGTNHEFVIKIVDENNRVIGTSETFTSFIKDKDIVLNFSISNISSSDVKIMDSGKWSYEVVSIKSKPKSITANAEYANYGGPEGLRLKDIKYNTNYPEINLYKAGNNIDAIEVYEKLAEQKRFNQKEATYAQDLFNLKKMTYSEDETPCYAWEIDYKNANIVRIYEDQTTDYPYTWKVKFDTTELGTVNDLLSKLNDLDVDGANWKYKIISPADLFAWPYLKIYRGLTKSESLYKKEEFLKKYKEANFDDKNKIYDEISIWSRYSGSNDEEKIAKELYECISNIQKFENGKKSTNISDLTLAENKGVVSVKNIEKGSKLETCGLMKKDVITEISVTEYDGSTRIISATELSKIPAPAKLKFTVQRGSGKKIQELSIEVPVEWK